MKKVISLILSAIITSSLYSQKIPDLLSSDLSFLDFSSENNYSKIKITYPVGEKCYYSTQCKFGEPEIPVIQKKFVIPINAVNVTVSVLSVKENQINGDFSIFPEQPPIPSNNSVPPSWIEPNPKIYNSDQDYPGKIVELDRVESTLGYKVVIVN